MRQITSATSCMKLGLALRYWGAGKPGRHAGDHPPRRRPGLRQHLDCGSLRLRRALVTGVVGIADDHVKLGNPITQMAARAPVATAMAAMTMDQLTGGRFVLGLGPSGPQVVEGWYRQPCPRPLERPREYVEILRRTMAPREGQLRRRTFPAYLDPRRARTPLQTAHRAGQVAALDPASAAGRPARPAGGRRTQERGAGGRGSRRLAPGVLQPVRRRDLPEPARRGLRPARRPGLRAGL